MPDYSPVRRNIPSPPGPVNGKISKKPGAPKAKGAVRAKSGCYTCRIRRKVGSPFITVTITPSTTAHPLLQKCDEQPNNQGSCQTCVRLRLQCLGFGAKRPEWMRVSISLWRPPAFSSTILISSSRSPIAFLFCAKRSSRSSLPRG